MDLGVDPGLRVAGAPGAQIWALGGRERDRDMP